MKLCSVQKLHIAFKKKDQIMSDNVAGDRIRVFIERIEALEGEKKEIQDHIKETLDEAKNEGFDVSILRKIIGLRKMDADARAEQETLLEVYLTALEES